MTPADCQGEASIFPSCMALVQEGFLLAGQRYHTWFVDFEEDSCILRIRRSERRLRSLDSENGRSGKLPGGSCPGGRRRKTVARGSGRDRDVGVGPISLRSRDFLWKSTDILVHTLVFGE